MFRTRTTTAPTDLLPKKKKKMRASLWPLLPEIAEIQKEREAVVSAGGAVQQSSGRKHA
jgi:hypothetical protein